MPFALRIILMTLLDALLVSASLYLSFEIRYDWNVPPHVLRTFQQLLLWNAAGRLLIFHFFGLYQWSFRYASLSEALQILRAVTAGTLALIAFCFFKHYIYIGRSVLLIDWVLCFFFASSFRFAFRAGLNLELKKYGKLTRVLIVGAGAAGQMVARELLGAKEKRFLPLGFVDDDPRKKEQRMHGVKVLGTTRALSEIISEFRVEEILIAIPSAPGNVIRNIILSCQSSNVKFKILPGIQKILEGHVELKTVRDVKPEDLLGRESVSINTDEVRQCVEDKAVLVTGAGGSIGSELVRQVARFDPGELILWDHNENDVYFLEIEMKKQFPSLPIHTVIGDIKDVSLLKHTFAKHRPKVVFHAAAHKHVPLMEENPCAVVKNNIIGTRNLIYAAEHYRVERFVLISTDKAVNPTSLMGASKRITEMLCQAKAKTSRTKFMAVRFGNVIGSNGSVVQLFKKQIEAGGPLTVTHPDIKRYFMTVPEAAQLVVQAAAIGKGGEIFILDMGEQIKILELAKNLIALSGLELEKDIHIEYTGLRPGEKLYEEMLHDTEHDQSTRHDKIFIAQPEEFDLLALRKNMEALKLLSEQMDEEGVRQKIKQMVPTCMDPHRSSPSSPTPEKPASVP